MRSLLGEVARAPGLGYRMASNLCRELDRQNGCAYDVSMNPRPSCHLPRQRHWRRLLQCRGGISVFLADHCGNDGANPLLGPEPPAMRSHKTATVCISFWRNHRLPASAKPWEVRRQSPCLMPGPDAPPLPFWIPGSRNDGGGSGSATPSPQPSPATGRGSKRPRPIRSSRFQLSRE